MPTIIAALFQTPLDGKAAHDELLANGFTRDEVSFVAGRLHDPEPLAEIIGLTVEAIALLVPGSGPLVAAGPLAGAISQRGAAHKGIAEVLLNHGVSPERAAYYVDGIARGGSLVAVHDVTGDAETKARAILDRSGAVKSEELAAD